MTRPVDAQELAALAEGAAALDALLDEQAVDDATRQAMQSALWQAITTDAEARRQRDARTAQAMQTLHDQTDTASAHQPDNNPISTTTRQTP